MNVLPESNPFTDPSVTKLIDQNTSADSAAGIVRNFNPFVEEIGIKREEAVGPTNQEIVDAATRDLRRQQESLDRVANRLENYQPEHHIQTVIQSEQVHNCPPLPPCCPIKPCYYQNISEEIPQQFQRIVRFHFYFWIAYWIHLFINALGCLAWLIVVEEKGKLHSGISLGVSIGYFFLLAPCSYVCWFRPLYKAFRSDSSLSFFVYFLIFFAQIIVLVIDSIGFFYYGTVGWINSFSCFAADRYGVGIFMLVIGIIFDVLAIIGIIMIARVNYIYRHTGASFEMAKQELGQRITSNQMVQETATGAARGATRSAVDGVFANSPY